MFKRVNKESAKEIIATQNNTILVDIRDSESYQEGHDPQALHLTQEVLPDFIANTNKDVPVLVMCYHGNSSQSVAQYLATQGFETVYSIDGGYEEWKNQ